MGGLLGLNLKYLFPIIFFLLTLGSVSAADVTECMNLTDSTTYDLQNDVNANGNCFTVRNGSLTLDCHGFMINGSNSSTGIEISNQNNITIRNCTIQNYYFGLSLNWSDNNDIVNNSILNNRFGINAINVSHTLIEQNIVNNNAGEPGDPQSGDPASTAITVLGSHNIIRNNTVQNNLAGITVTFGNPGNPIETINNTIADNDVSNNTFGISLSASYTTITSNTVNNNTGESGEQGPASSGISVTGSHNTLINNSLQNNLIGIVITSGNPGEPIETTNNTLINNSITTQKSSSNSIQGLFIGGISLSDHRQNINESNKIDGKKIAYYDGIYNPCPDNKPINLNATYSFLALVGCTNVNVTASNNFDHVLLAYTNNSKIYNMNVSYSLFAILLYSSSNNSLVNNTANSNIVGIILDSSSNNNLTNNTANSNSEGIFLDSSNNNNLTGNTADSNANAGIIIASSSNNALTGNTANSNSDTGIVLDGSNYNTITNNTVNLNDGTGVSIHSSNYTTLLDNVVTSNGGDGIYIRDSEENNLTTNDVRSNVECGISLGGVLYHNIVSNNVTNNSCGINLDASYNSIITNNAVNLNNGSGIALASSNNNTLSDNYVGSNEEGIHLESSSNYNMLTYNNVSNNTGAGVYLDTSSNNTLTYNNVSSNNGDGIYLGSSSNNTLTGNTFDSNANMGIFLSELSSYNTISDNTANSNAGSHGIGLANSSNNTLTNNTANLNNEGGITLDYSHTNTLTNNTANLNNHCGIQLLEGGFGEGSSNNIVRDNTANSNNASGICLQDSSNYNALTDNTADSNANQGIYLDSSSNNTLTGNSVWNNTYEIYLSSSSNDNNITNNWAINLGGGGSAVYVAVSEGNQFTGNLLNASKSPVIIIDASSSANTFTNTLFHGTTNFTSTSLSNVSLTINSTPPADPTDKHNLSDYLIIEDLGSGYITFNLSYASAELSSVAEDHTIRLYNYNESAGNWSIVSTSSFDTGNDTLLSGNITSGFGLYAAFGDINGTVPVVLSHSPTGTVTSSSTTLSATTDENAACRYSTTAGTAYVSMGSTMSGTGTSHTASLTGLTTGTAHYYIRCNNSDDFVSTIDYNASFTVSISTGGSSGGGGGGIVPSTEGVKEMEFSNPGADQEHVMHVSQEDIATTKVAFVNTVRVSSAKLTVQLLSTDVVDDVLENAYQYLNITLTGLQQAELSRAWVEFRVNRSWMDENSAAKADIRLKRYRGGTWNELDTLWVKDTDTYSYFNASTPGFSIFAIAFVTVEQPGAGEVQEPTVNQTEPPEPQVEPPVEPEPQPEPPKRPWALIALLFLIVGLCVGGLLYVRKARKTK